MGEDGTTSDEQRTARRAMIATQIEARGVGDPGVLAAIERVPRELFVPEVVRELAYEDRALVIDAEQTISQPYIVAYMTSALGVEPGHKVLEIGTGSGYQAAILSELTQRLYTIERIATLSEAASARLRLLGIEDVRYRVGDGSLGWPEEAPFDRIIATAAAPAVPQPLLDQLSVGGRIVIPVGNTERQTLLSITKHSDRTVERPLIPCRFVKFIGEAAWR